MTNTKYTRIILHKNKFYTKVKPPMEKSTIKKLILFEIINVIDLFSIYVIIPIIVIILTFYFIDLIVVPLSPF